MVNTVSKTEAESMDVFDRDTVRHNRNRAAPHNEHHNFLFDWAIDNITDRLDVVRRDFPEALIIGARQTSSKLDHLKAVKNIRTLSVMDIVPDILMPQRNYTTILAESDILPLSRQSLDLIISNLDLHSVNDVPGALIQMHRALRPDGLFVASLFGGETLSELRQCLTQAEMSIRGGLSPRVAPFADKQQMGNVMQRAGFALPVIDSDIVTVTYENIFKLMKDLRGMGEANAVSARDRSPLRRDVLMKAAEMYQAQFAEPDGRIRATFEIIFLLGWAPHDSQQKPLRPGSADHNLADALGVEEIGTGEKPNQ